MYGKHAGSFILFACLSAGSVITVIWTTWVVLTNMHVLKRELEKPVCQKLHEGDSFEDQV